MEKIKIITDSTADLPPDIIDKYDIDVLPLLVNISGKSYLDGIEISLRSLLDKMSHSEEFPTTSQVNPETFLDSYRRYLDEGYKIISIHISSKMSGVYQSACIAKGMLESEDIHIIDSRNVTAGLGLLVLKAGVLRNEGKSAAEINEGVMKILPHVKSALVFDSLENLVRGGRLTKTEGKVGNMLGIKLIMEVGDGEIKLLNKVRGNKRAVKYVTKYLDRMGISGGETSVLLHVDSAEILPVLRGNMSDCNIDFFECEVGCVVGVHSGAGACGIFFVESF